MGRTKEGAWAKPKQTQGRVALANARKKERHEKLREAKQRQRNQDLSAHGADGHDVKFT